jgi:alkylhydroperoxidase family enzyme
MATATPRIGPLPRAEWTDSARDVFAYWEGPAARENGSRSNTMMTLANHPRLAIASLDMGKYMLVESSLGKREKELVILRVAWRYGSNYQWAHHVHSARQIGMTDAEFEALQKPGPASIWSSGDQALISAVDQLCEAGRIDDPTWAQLSAAMDKQQLMDFLYSVGFFTMNAWAFGAMGVQLEPEFEAFSTPADQLVGGGGNSK